MEVSDRTGPARPRRPRSRADRADRKSLSPFQARAARPLAAERSEGPSRSPSPLAAPRSAVQPAACLPKDRHASWSDLPQLSEQSERSERREFCGRPAARAPQVAPEGGRRQWGRLFFAYFLLAKQKKVSRPPGRRPGSGLQTTARCASKAACPHPNPLPEGEGAIPRQPAARALAKQKKVSRLPGRRPGSGLGTNATHPSGAAHRSKPQGPHPNPPPEGEGARARQASCVMPPTHVRPQHMPLRRSRRGLEHDPSFAHHHDPVRQLQQFVEVFADRAARRRPSAAPARCGRGSRAPPRSPGRTPGWPRSAR